MYEKKYSSLYRCVSGIGPYIVILRHASPASPTRNMLLCLCIEVFLRCACAHAHLNYDFFQSFCNTALPTLAGLYILTPDFTGYISVTWCVRRCFFPSTTRSGSVSEVEHHSHLMLMICSDCFHFMIFLGLCASAAIEYSTYSKHIVIHLS